jgi:non-specific serine/threonine protein kinase
MNRMENEIQTPRPVRRNIPIVRTSFIGREREMGEVTRLLGSSRLVTLIGAAGCGKTRLAIRAAEKASSHYPDGVYWVELAQLSDPTLIPQTVARVLRVAEQPDRPSLERLLDALHGKQILLVLDNCEHLLNGCAQFVEALLGETEVRVLATSREPLSIMGEKLYPVDPLSLPPSDIPADDVGGISQFDAVQLFVERARAIQPAFELTADNSAVVASICRDLGGIPLAIELASARLKILTAEQIAARLDDHFNLLPPATPVTHSHHKTLRAAIDWSYDLLSKPERFMLRRLSVFAGGCSLTTAETVCAGEGVERERILELLSSLADKSLIVAETLQQGEARYSLLETIRQYAEEKLIDSGEWSRLHDRHLQCYLQITEGTAPKLQGRYQELWLNWLEGEYDNIRAALSWSLERDRIEVGLRIAIALYQFWTIRDYVEEGLSWLERLRAGVGEDVSAVVRANALAYASFLAGFRGRIPARIAYGREAAALAKRLGEEDKQALAWALAAQGYGVRATGDYQTEFTISQRLIQLYREFGDTYRLGMALSLYSVPAMALGEYEAAREMLDEGLPLLREYGDPYRIAMALNYYGDLARCERKYSLALPAYEESLSLLREIDAVRDLASVLHNLGHTCLHLGDVERAQTLFQESMALHREQGNRPGMAECLIGFAGLALTRDLPAAGARLLAAAESIGERHITSEWAATRLEYEGYLARARAELSEEEFQAERAVGRKLSLKRAVAYAEEVARKAAAAHKARRKLDKLTPREREVAALVAGAKSNGEIAKELVVSKRTVEKHISNIRSKLRFTKRAQIVRWAIEAGLADASD